MKTVFPMVLLVATMTAPAQPQPPAVRPGAVEGFVTFTGNLPVSSAADDAGLRRPLLDVDAETRGMRFLVADLAGEGATANASPTAEQTNAPVVIDQQDHTFVPHLVAVRRGQAVIFTNSDPANHNVRASSPSPTNQFNVFTGAGGRYEHRFAPDAQGRPVRLDCDIHPWMRAWIYVFDHPHFAVSDARGRFRIASVSPGTYRLVLRQPDIGYASERSVVVKPGETTRVEIGLSPRDVRTR